MKVISPLIILFFGISSIAALKCLECSEKDSENAKKCSVNSTNYRESDGTQVSYCRLWSIGDSAVHRTMVGEESCTEATLKQNVENDIIGKFEGEGDAKAQCCNWTLCNLNVTWAALTEAPSMALSINFVNGLALLSTTLLVLILLE